MVVFAPKFNSEYQSSFEYSEEFQEPIIIEVLTIFIRLLYTLNRGDFILLLRGGRRGKLLQKEAANIFVEIYKKINMIYLIKHFFNLIPTKKTPISIVKLKQGGPINQ